ncbi:MULTISPECIES: hypothetical protein [Kocuria]|uniref:hypothetical protein n=1 Tax=Kocuria TaxID=57493 RepID=UPI0026DEAEBF|nr:hypothetical protein [Kocuria sp.]
MPRSLGFNLLLGELVDYRTGERRRRGRVRFLVRECGSARSDSRDLRRIKMLEPPCLT